MATAASARTGASESSASAAEASLILGRLVEVGERACAALADRDYETGLRALGERDLLFESLRRALEGLSGGEAPASPAGGAATGPAVRGALEAARPELQRLTELDVRLGSLLEAERAHLVAELDRLDGRSDAARPYGMTPSRGSSLIDTVG